jgi:hypothetical protein
MGYTDGVATRRTGVPATRHMASALSVRCRSTMVTRSTSVCCCAPVVVKLPAEDTDTTRLEHTFHPFDSDDRVWLRGYIPGHLSAAARDVRTATLEGAGVHVSDLGLGITRECSPMSRSSTPCIAIRQSRRSRSSSSPGLPLLHSCTIGSQSW